MTISSLSVFVEVFALAFAGESSMTISSLLAFVEV